METDPEATPDDRLLARTEGAHATAKPDGPLVLDGVTVRYGTEVAVDGAALTAHAGDVVAVTGHSGAAVLAAVGHRRRSAGLGAGPASAAPGCRDVRRRRNWASR